MGHCQSSGHGVRWLMLLEHLAVTESIATDLSPSEGIMRRGRKFWQEQEEVTVRLRSIRSGVWLLFRMFLTHLL